MGVEFTRRKKNWIILVGLFGLSSYGAYRLYHVPSLVSKRKRVLKLLGAFVSVAEMLSNSTQTVTLVSKDIRDFLHSNSDQIPNSFKQLSKLATSQEFRNSVTRVSEAVTVGIMKGYGSKGKANIDSPSFADKVMDRMMSKAGTGFVSVVVGSFARNLVAELYSRNGLNVDDNKNSSNVPRWVDVVCDDRCKPIIANCIQTFVSTAVAIYLDKTMHVNSYDEIFSGLTNPKHQAKMRDILISLCNGAVETFVKTSHQVMTASRSDSDPSLNSVYSTFHESEYACQRNHKVFEKVSSEKLDDMSQPVDIQANGWLSCVSSTLAVPRNRRFVLAVTGRVTFDTAKSIVEFFIWKLAESLKRNASVVHEEVVERGLQVITYIGAKSSVVLTICLALFLHILGSTQAFLPA